MATVKKAREEDFEAIYKVLLDFNNPAITMEGWRTGLITPWEKAEDYLGYVLLEDNEVVGFLGLLFARRRVNGMDIPFCNMTAWIVKPGYRAETLSLLYPVLELEHHTITNFTSSPSVYQILRRLGFDDIDSRYRVLLPIPALRSFGLRPPGLKVTLDRAAIQSHLSPEELRIYQDHSPFKCLHVLITFGEKHCYLLLTRFRRKRLYFAHVHYVSNLDLFLEGLDSFKFPLLARLRVLAIIMDERLLKGRSVALTSTRRMISNRLVKSNQLGRFDIDNLYSELLTFAV